LLSTFFHEQSTASIPFFLATSKSSFEMLLIEKGFNKIAPQDNFLILFLIVQQK